MLVAQVGVSCVAFEGVFVCNFAVRWLVRPDVCCVFFTCSTSVAVINESSRTSTAIVSMVVGVVVVVDAVMTRRCPIFSNNTSNSLNFVEIRGYSQCGLVFN